MTTKYRAVYTAQEGERNYLVKPQDVSGYRWESDTFDLFDSAQEIYEAMADAVRRGWGRVLPYTIEAVEVPDKPVQMPCPRCSGQGLVYAHVGDVPCSCQDSVPERTEGKKFWMSNGFTGFGVEIVHIQREYSGPAALSLCQPLFAEITGHTVPKDGGWYELRRVKE